MIRYVVGTTSGSGQDGLGPGGIAGIVVGSVAALALFLLVAGFIAYRRFQEHKVEHLPCLIDLVPGSGFLSSQAASS